MDLNLPGCRKDFNWEICSEKKFSSNCGCVSELLDKNQSEQAGLHPLVALVGMVVLRCLLG